jgi:ribosomal-protein-alanine N-acetyltransferase
MLTLAPPVPSDADILLQFELVNRAYFESHVNARPLSFYSPEGVAQAIAQAQRDAEEDKAFQYLVRDAAGRLVGRVFELGGQWFDLLHFERRLRA